METIFEKWVMVKVKVKVTVIEPKNVMNMACRQCYIINHAMK